MNTNKESIQFIERALKDYSEATAYNDDREIYYHVCCRQYVGDPHGMDCKAVKALNLLEEMKKQTN